MKTLTKCNLATGAAVLGSAIVLAAFWLAQPAHAKTKNAAEPTTCGAARVVDNRVHPGIDIKLLVHRPSAAPRVLRLDV